MYVIPGFMWPSPFFMVVAVLLKQAFHRIASIMNKNQKVSSKVIQKTERYDYKNAKKNGSYIFIYFMKISR